MIPFILLFFATILFYWQANKQQTQIPNALRLKRNHQILKLMAIIFSWSALAIYIIEQGWIKGILFFGLMFSLISSLLIILLPILFSIKE